MSAFTNNAEWLAVRLSELDLDTAQNLRLSFQDIPIYQQEGCYSKDREKWYPLYELSSTIERKVPVKGWVRKWGSGLLQFGSLHFEELFGKSVGDIRCEVILRKFSTMNDLDALEEENIPTFANYIQLRCYFLGDQDKEKILSDVENIVRNLPEAIFSSDSVLKKAITVSLLLGAVMKGYTVVFPCINKRVDWRKMDIAGLIKK